MAKTRLNKNVDLDWHAGRGLEAIDRSPEALVLVQKKVDAIAEACNSESSWGGYKADAAIHPDRVRGTVWLIDSYPASTRAYVNEARENRMLKNLDA